MWIFAEALMLSISADYLDVAVFNFIFDASKIFIGFTFPLFLHFTIIFTENGKFLEKKARLILLYLPAVIFVSMNAITDFFMEFRLIENMGIYWWRAGRHVLWTGLFVLIYFIPAFYLIWRTRQRSNDPFQKKQMKTFFWTILSGLSIAFVNNIIVASFGSISLSFFTGISAMAIVSLLSYFIIRHDLLVITPQIAAEAIMKTIPDFLVAFNNDSKIVFANARTIDATGYGKGSIEGLSWKEIFRSDGKLKDVEKSIYRQAILERPAVLVGGDGEEIPVNLSTSPIRERSGRLAGAVIIGRDMRRINTFIARLERSKADTEERNEKLKELNEKLQEQYQESEHINKLLVDRELKMIELKEEIAELKRGRKDRKL